MDDSVEDPRSGQRWVFRARRDDLLEADLYVSRGGFVRSHVHPQQEETFTGVSGTFVLEVARESKRIGPGDTVVVPPRMPHGFAEAADEAHVLVMVRPALELENYFRVFLGLSRDGRIRMPLTGLPGPLLLVAAVMHCYAARSLRLAGHSGFSAQRGGPWLSSVGSSGAGRHSRSTGPEVTWPSRVLTYTNLRCSTNCIT